MHIYRQTTQQWHQSKRPARRGERHTRRSSHLTANKHLNQNVEQISWVVVKRLVLIERIMGHFSEKVHARPPLVTSAAPKSWYFCVLMHKYFLSLRLNPLPVLAPPPPPTPPHSEPRRSNTNKAWFIVAVWQRWIGTECEGGGGYGDKQHFVFTECTVTLTVSTQSRLPEDNKP